MLNQSTSGDNIRLIGKQYQGNKLCVIHDICWNRKSSKIRNLLYHKTCYLLKKIKKYHALRPSYNKTIPELLAKEDKIIIIRRDKASNYNSILTRTTMPYKKAAKEHNLDIHLYDDTTPISVAAKKMTELANGYSG